MDRKQVLIAALQQASKAILAHDPAKVSTDIKSGAGDFVTAADLASERAIMETIRQTFPDDVIISEETTEGHELLDTEHRGELTAWVTDPLDGTHNFKRGLTYCGISLGYIERGEIILGGIYDPYRGALYLAEKGKGATCNDQPINVSAKQTFDTGTRVCTCNSYEGRTLQSLNRYQKLGDVWIDVLGSAVLVMADIAAGRLDLFHHHGLKPWDNAAGFLIATEAGAKIVGLQGQPVTCLTEEVVMGNSTLVDEFVRRTIIG